MLRLPHLTLIKPGTVQAALMALGSSPQPKILAGGTDLMVALKYGLVGNEALVSLGGLKLDHINKVDAGVDLGPSATLWDLIRKGREDELLAPLARAASLVASPPIQSRATLGGNVCLDTRCFLYNQTAFWRSARPACFKAGGKVCHVAPGGDRCHACHQSDLAPVLIAMGATATVESEKGRRTIPLEDLYTGDGAKPLSLAADELLTSIRLKAGGSTGFEKFRMRKGLDFAVASAAIYLEKAADGTCRNAKVVLGSVGTGPIRVLEAEAALNNSKLEPEALEAAKIAASKAAKPMKNVDLTPAYRRKVAGVAVARAAVSAFGAKG